MMLTKDVALEVLREISPIFVEEGLKRGEILLGARSGDGYTIRHLYRDYGPEFALRFLLIDSTLDTQQVTRLRAESIHRTMLDMREHIHRHCGDLSETKNLAYILTEALKANFDRVLTQVNHATNFIRDTESIESWLSARKPHEAYRDLMLANAFGSYDKCARLYLKFVGHPNLGLNIIKNWEAHLNEFPIVVDGAIGRFFLTTGLIQPFLTDFFGSKRIAEEYLNKIATFQGYDAKYVCAVALEDPINYLVSGRKHVPDTLAFENGIWRFSRRGGVCLDNPSSRRCGTCPLGKIMTKFNIECNMDYRAYGGPLFSQICQNYIDYQKDVVHLCREKTEKCFQETFENKFGRPLSPSLVKTRFVKNRKIKRFVHLMPQR
jgi:hypothetical protein